MLNLTNEAIMSLIEQRDGLNEKVNELEAEIIQNEKDFTDLHLEYVTSEKAADAEIERLTIKADDYMGMYQVISKREADYVAEIERLRRIIELMQVEVRNDQFLMEDIKQTLPAFKLTKENRKAGFSDGFDHGFYQACLVKNIEVNRYRNLYGTQCQITKNRDGYLKESDNELLECRALLRRFLPKDETDWVQIIQLTQTEKDAMEYFRRQK